MTGPFAITIIFIVLLTVVAAFVSKRNRDKCFKDFTDDLITLETTTTKITRGKLNVENTGLEFVYNTEQKTKSMSKRVTFCTSTIAEHSSLDTLLR